MARRKKLYAVLTGDIVKSTSFDARALARIRSEVKRAGEAMAAWRGGLVRCGAEFTRGDQWQAALAGPDCALRAAIYLRARLKAFHGADTRIAIGVGHVQRFSAKTVFESSGEAFVLSGRALDALGQDRLCISVNDALGEAFSPLTAFFEAAVTLCDGFVEDWTDRQAEYVSVAASPLNATHDDVAKVVGASRQAAQKSLDAAHWRRLEALIDAFEAVDWAGHGR